MKFSVLLPTRNRLDLLRYAVESVRRQDYDNWEIIISDNFSDEDIAGYVRLLQEPRIHYYRTESFVPVTKNWNNALEKCSGDYVIMLGDDDCIMKDYFSKMRQIIETYRNPDFIYTSAFLYAYPNVMPGFPQGFLQTYGYADFLTGAREPFWLRKEQALTLVRQSMKFKVRFGFNMQFAFISRRIITTLRQKGDFFQSPYPDYYAMNAMLLAAERIVVFPEPVVTIGISPKSFGYYYFNESEQGGVEFLKNLPDAEVASRVKDVILPGTNMNTSWLLSMETLLMHYGAEFNLSVHYSRYRFLQMLHVMSRFIILGEIAQPDVRQLKQLISSTEKTSFNTLLAFFWVFSRPFPQRYRKKMMQVLFGIIGTYPRFKPIRIEGSFKNILEVFEQIDPYKRY